MKIRISLIVILCIVTMSVMGQTYKTFTTANGLSSSLVNFVYEDHYGLIWIATEDGLNKYDGVKMTSYRHDYGKENSLANNYVSTVIEDAKGNLIVATYNGIQMYRHDTDDFSPLATFEDDGKVMESNISIMMREKNGRVYGVGMVACEIITTPDRKLVVKRLAREHFSGDLMPGLPKELNIRSTLRYDNSHLLLGTDGNGIKLYDEQSKTYVDYPLDIPGISQDLQKVHHIIRDNSGNLWIALYQKGVVMVSQRRSMFEYLGSRTTQHNLIGSHCIQAICRSSKGGIWVGTDGDGLYHLVGNNSTHITKGVPPIINAVMEDSEGALWVGSYGYDCMRCVNGQFTKVEGLFWQPQIFTIKEDRNRRVWLGSMGWGLYYYDLGEKSAKKYEDWDVNRYINCIYLTSKNDILIGTFDGVYDITNRKHFCNKYIVYSIFEDYQGALWIGTSEGLIKHVGDKQKVFSTSDGMTSNTVFAINQDESRKIWFSTNSGLTSYDEKEDVFTNYTVSDGIQGNEFSKGAMIKDEDGTLWFAGHEGITYFSPNYITLHEYNLHPRITALYINNVPVTTNTETGDEHVMDTTIYDCKNFSIAYENNSFSIELATVEIDKPAKCTFLYSLDGHEWINIPDGGHVVSFSNLSAGSHSFKYAVEYNGKRSETEEVTITIRRPWWGSVWAQIMIALVIITMITLIFFWIQSREKVKALALISHKIRTPMSLIISPLIQLIDSDKDEQRQKTYKMMLRNAEKLQTLAAQATEEQPIGPITKVQEKDEESADIQQSRSTKHLLIVEDDDEVRKYLCEEMSADYHVREATNGKDALDLIFEKMPDAIISDVTMPQMDGITLCRKIKRNIQLAHIPVVLLTARADEDSTLQGLGIGADAYITKPFNIKILRTKINNLILLRQQLRNTYQGQQLQEDKLENIEAEDYDDMFMERLMAVINKHLSDPDFSIDMMCNEVGISRASLHRKLKEKTNQSASIFIRNIRLKQAEKLLSETNLRINEIALQVGFKQSSYFINSFRDLYGLSPNEWREQKK